MRIGIVADIHDAAGPLRDALALLRRHAVDHVVTLGDAFESYRPGEPAAEVARLLEEAGAVGVWGNHDFGLSVGIEDELRREADAALLRFAARLEPQIVVAGCRFCHIEPWRDPRSLADLWNFDEMPTTRERAQRSFAAVPERVIFIGHFHSWFVVGSRGTTDWDGRSALVLPEPERYLVSVGAVLRGSCGVYDTDQNRLMPMQMLGGDARLVPTPFDRT